MKRLSDRVAEARDIAAEREGDIRIKEFLRAITIAGSRQSAVGSRSRDTTGAPERLEVSIDCHQRSWHRLICADEAAQLTVMTPDQLAAAIAGWVKQAISDDLLLLSNPPRDRASDPTAFAVGALVTYTFDRHGSVVGSRWG